MGRIFLVSGDDDFARKQRTREIAAELCGEADPESAASVEIIPGDAPELKPEDLAARFLDALRTPPFLCDRKIVWMRHHPDLDRFTTERPSATLAELCTMLVSPLPEEIDVLIDGPGLDKRKSFFKELKNLGAQIECFTITRASDKSFAESRRRQLDAFARSTGKRFTADALNFLCEAISGDSGTFANELEKLHCYTGDAREITLDDCRAIVSRTQEALSWEFTSAVVECNRKRALLTLGVLLSQRESGMELRMLAGLSGEYQRMIQTRLAMKQLKISRPGPNSFSSLPPEAKTQFPDNPLLKMHPYRAFKVCEAAMRLGGGDLAEKLTAIRDTSRALVSGGGDSRILLEQLVCRLCRRA